jgi:hypothetical protein
MTTTVPPQGANGAQAKRNTTKNSSNHFAGFAPSFGLNVNVQSGGNGNGPAANGGTPAAAGGGNGRQQSLPEPYFASPADIRDYCNHLRAIGVGLSFEVAMAAEILKATLATVPDPDGKPFGSKLRARRVARKLAKSAEALKDAAVNAAAAYGAFQQEYEGEINQVRHRARKPEGPRMDWANQ